MHASLQDLSASQVPVTESMWAILAPLSYYHPSLNPKFLQFMDFLPSSSSFLWNLFSCALFWLLALSLGSLGSCSPFVALSPLFSLLSPLLLSPPPLHALVQSTGHVEFAILSPSSGLFQMFLAVVSLTPTVKIFS